MLLATSIPYLARNIEAELAIRKNEKKEDAKAESATDEKEVNEEQTIDQNQMMGIQARNRMNNWAANTVDDMQLLTKLRKGLVTHHSVHAHEFRDRDKSMEKTGVPFMSRT